MENIFVFVIEGIEIQNGGFFQQKSYISVYFNFSILTQNGGVERIKLIDFVVLRLVVSRGGIITRTIFLV